MFCVDPPAFVCAILVESYLVIIYRGYKRNMNSISNDQTGVNKAPEESGIIHWFGKHKLDITIFAVIFLLITAAVGFYRLWQLTPPKEPIRVVK